MSLVNISLSYFFQYFYQIVLFRQIIGCNGCPYCWRATGWIVPVQINLVHTGCWCAMGRVDSAQTWSSGPDPVGYDHLKATKKNILKKLKQIQSC